jgi:hypothetical protein
MNKRSLSGLPPYFSKKEKLRRRIDDFVQRRRYATLLRPTGATMWVKAEPRPEPHIVLLGEGSFWLPYYIVSRKSQNESAATPCVYFFKLLFTPTFAT